MRTLLVPFALAIAAAGCASHVAGPSGKSEAMYRVGSDIGSMTSTEAEVRHSELTQSTSTNLGLDRPLKIISSPFSDYSRSLQNANTQGDVQVDFDIEPDGSVSNPVVAGRPDSALAAISVGAVAQWRFAPPMRNGQPVRVRTCQVFSFKVSN
jgi:TonB family protein